MCGGGVGDQVAITQPVFGQYVIDFGQNIAGQTTTSVVCPDGPQTITYLYGESLHPDGTVLNQYGDIMRANYTCAGTGDVETYTTLFRWGCRVVASLCLHHPLPAVTHLKA